MGFISKEAHVNPILAELRALRHGLLMAVEYKLHPLDININSSKMVKLLKHDKHPYTNLSLNAGH